MTPTKPALDMILRVAFFTNFLQSISAYTRPNSRGAMTLVGRATLFIGPTRAAGWAKVRHGVYVSTIVRSFPSIADDSCIFFPLAVCNSIHILLIRRSTKIEGPIDDSAPRPVSQHRSTSIAVGVFFILGAIIVTGVVILVLFLLWDVDHLEIYRRRGMKLHERTRPKESCTYIFIHHYFEVYHGLFRLVNPL